VQELLYGAMIGVLYIVYGLLILAGAAIYVGLGYEVLHHLGVL
jgi:hypothetical protein